MDIWFKNILLAIIILAASLGAAKLSQYVLTKWLSKFTRFTKTAIDDKIINAVKKPIYFIILLLGLRLASDTLSLPVQIQKIINGATYIVGVFIAVLVIYRVADLLLKWYLKKLAKKTDKAVEKDFLPLIEKVSSIFIFLIGIIVVLKHFNYDVLSLVTALGIGSLAIGLAAKDTLANMISGFTIMVDRPFRVGDRIQLSSGEVGDVLEIGLRSTKIKTFDNTVIIVPNTELANMKLINQAYPDSLLKARIDIGIGYGSDVEKAKKIMIDAALSIDYVVKDPPPIVYFDEFGDSALLLYMRFWVKEYLDRMLARDAINMLIKKRFEEEGIEIPFPIRTVHMEPEKSVRVRRRSK
jgi:small-conductance mechanosensitive channel